MLRVGWLGTYAQAQHDDFADVVGQGAIPIVHDQDIAISEARLALDAGITARFAASLVIPVRVVATSIVYRDGSGAPVQLTEPNVHHRNETLTGIADPMLLGAVTQHVGDVRLTARAGASIPLGRTEDDPFELGAMGVPHQHIQMGTGTFNPVLAIEAAYAWDRWHVGGFLFTQQVVYENGKGYHAGDRYAAGLALRRAVGTVWGVRGGPEFQAETAERWNGVQHTDEGNQGRIDVLLGAGVTWSPLPRWAFDFSLKVPLYTHVVGGQLAVPAIVELGAAWTFGREHRHEHDHEHEHEHDHDGEVAEHDDHAIDTTGADVADASTGGQRVDLVPVAGKITIFDFWAQWCKPCKTLEPSLVDLARGNPNVAVRRVEVVDWDSPVVAQHLARGGYDLPHLKVYDANGNLVLEQSSAPGKLEALIDAVRVIANPSAASTTSTAASGPSTTSPPTTTPPTTSPPPTSSPTTSPPTTSPPTTSPPTEPPAKPPVVAPKLLVIEIAASDKGFAPNDIKVPRKRPVVLRFRRVSDKTCATEVSFDHDGKHVLRDLPRGKAVDIAVTFEQPGTITFRCAMDMYRGTITVQ